jgi:hypothetical protein
MEYAFKCFFTQQLCICILQLDLSLILGRKLVTRAMVASAPKREKDPKKRVVITGMGLVSVFGNDVDAYYQKLLEGQSGITLIDRFDASKFPTRFAGQIKGFSSEGYIDGKNDRRLDDCLRYCLVSGKKALEDANLGSEKLSEVGSCLLFSSFYFHLYDVPTLWEYDYRQYVGEQ